MKRIYLSILFLALNANVVAQDTWYSRISNLVYGAPKPTIFERVKNAFGGFGIGSIKNAVSTTAKFALSHPYLVGTAIAGAYVAYSYSTIYQINQILELLHINKKDFWGTIAKMESYKPEEQERRIPILITQLQKNYLTSNKDEIRELGGQLPEAELKGKEEETFATAKVKYNKLWNKQKDIEKTKPLIALLPESKNYESQEENDEQDEDDQEEKSWVDSLESGLKYLFYYPVKSLYNFATSTRPNFALISTPYSSINYTILTRKTGIRRAIEVLRKLENTVLEYNLALDMYLNATYTANLSWLETRAKEAKAPKLQAAQNTVEATVEATVDVAAPQPVDGQVNNNGATGQQTQKPVKKENTNNKWLVGAGIAAVGALGYLTHALLKELGSESNSPFLSY